MKHIFRLTRDDYWYLNRYALLKNKAVKRGLLYSMVLIPALVFFFIFFVTKFLLYALAVSFATALGGGMMLFFTTRKKVYELVDARPDLLEEYVFSDDERGFQLKTTAENKFYPWRELKSIRRKKGMIILDGGAFWTNMIPENSFSSEEELRDFTAELEKRKS